MPALTATLKRRIRFNGLNPIHPYRYVHPEDGAITLGITLTSLHHNAYQHMRMNGYVIPEDWKAVVEDQACLVLPTTSCLWEDGTPCKEPRVDVWAGYDDVLRGFAVFVDWTAKGFPLVDKTEADRRAAICRRCPFNLPIKGCGSCAKLTEKVTELLGRNTTDDDPWLAGKSCAVCHCSNAAQVWFPAEILKKGVTPEMVPLFQQNPKCWKTEIALS
jgi:hypothetical protein